MKYPGIYILLLVYYAETSRNDYKFHPNLPAGEYHAYTKAILFCNNVSRDTEWQTNFYLSKKSRNVTEIKGNLTFKVPFDDSWSFQVNMAIKDSIGGWKDNAVVYKSSNACSTLKNLVGNGWSYILNTFGIENKNCPIRQGVYISNGYDLTNFTSNWNIPKTFFYGEYKVRVYGTDSTNKIKFCIILVVEVKRPWETE